MRIKDSLSFGERRWRAAKRAELDSIPAVYRASVDLLELAIIENLQRKNLHPIEEAEALYRLKQQNGYTDQKLGEMLGKSRVVITELLSLRKLPDHIKEECRARDNIGKRQLLQLVRLRDRQKIETFWKKMEADKSPNTSSSKSKRSSTKKTIKRERDGVQVIVRYPEDIDPSNLKNAVKRIDRRARLLNVSCLYLSL